MKKEKISNEFRKHKNKLLIGVTVVIVGVVLFSKTRNLGKTIKVSDEIAFSKQNIERIPKVINIASHKRTLPVGKKASCEKVITALENGFDLNKGETWVTDYMKKVS